MKHISKFSILAVLFSAALVSCVKEQDPTSKVYFPGEDTYWSGDKTSLYNGERVLADIHLPEGTKGIRGIDALEVFASNDLGESDFDVFVFQEKIPESYKEPENEDVFDFETGVDVYAVVKPDIAALGAWFEKQGLTIDVTQFEGVEFMAFNAYGDMCTVSSVGEDATGSMMGLVNWLETLNAAIFKEDQQNTFAAESNGLLFVKEYDNRFNMHSSNHTIDFAVNNVCFAEVACSNKDYRSGRGYLNYKWDVRPIHVFNGSSNPGDYYMVSLEVTLVSDGMYDSKNLDIRHGGVHVRNRGFYAKELSVSASVCEKKGNAYSPVGFFSQSPSPETTEGKTVYNHGLGFFFNGDITGGLSLNLDGLNAKFGATILGGLTIGSSESRVVNDLDIYNNSYGCLSRYTYKFNNSPHMPGGWCYLTEPTQVSVGGATFRQDFILYVKDVPEYSNIQHYLNVNIDNLVYGICRFYSTKADFKEFIVNAYDSRMQINGGRSFYVQLPKPNRIPTGLVEIKNDGSSLLVNRYIFKIEFVSTKDSNVKYTYDQVTIGSGLFEKFSHVIPEGVYNVNIEYGNNTRDTYWLTTNRPITVSRSATCEMRISTHFN